MNVTTRTPHFIITNSSATWDFTGLSEWEYFAPIHVFLSVYIISQNSLIIFHYHKDWRRVSSLFFILIAASDIGFALSELGLATLELLCVEHFHGRLNKQAGLFLILTGYLFNVISVFLGLTLTVVKTINIMFPFYRLEKRFLYATVFVGIIFYLALYIGDNIPTPTFHVIGNVKCRAAGGIFPLMVVVQTVGMITITELSHLNFGDSFSLLIIQFCLPGVIVLVCMILQMFHIRKIFGRSENPEQNSANHVNLTVFLISVLYFCSVSVFSITPLLFGAYYGYANIVNKIYILTRFTLPLINAALFPYFFFL